MDLPKSPPGPRGLVAAAQPEPGGPPVCQSVELRAGDTCPACRTARLDYNGLLYLACPACGYSLGGGFT